MTEQKLDLQNAQSAFNSFFQVKDGKVQTGKEEANPAQKVLNQIDQNNTPPDKKTITTVDASGNASTASNQSASVDDAKEELNRDLTFDEILAKNKIANSEIFAIVDSYLEKGYYEQSYKIKSLQYTFRTKKVHSIDTINDSLDGAKYASEEAANQLYIESALAATLVAFKQGSSPARIFSHNSQEEDALALKFVRTELSSPIYAILSKDLMKFDIRVGLATRDEAIERFLAHTQG